MFTGDYIPGKFKGNYNYYYAYFDYINCGLLIFYCYYCNYGL